MALAVDIQLLFNLCSVPAVTVGAVRIMANSCFDHIFQRIWAKPINLAPSDNILNEV